MTNKALVWPVTNASYGSVFYDLRGFFAKTWAWILLLWAEQIAVGFATEYLPAWTLTEELMTWPSMLIFAGAAVAWHRKILVDDRKQGLQAVSLRSREWKYFAVAFLTSMGFIAPFAVIKIVADKEWLAGSADWWIILPITLFFAEAYVVIRLSLVFPLFAIDESEPFSKSWRLLSGRVFRTFMICLLTTTPLSFVGQWIDKLSAAAFEQGQDVFGYAVEGVSCIVSIMTACVVAASLSLILTRVRSSDADISRKRWLGI